MLKRRALNKFKMYWLAMLTSTHTDAHLFNLKNAKTLQSLLPTHSKQKKKKKHKKQKEKKKHTCQRHLHSTIKHLFTIHNSNNKNNNTRVRKPPETTKCIYFFFYLFFNVHSSLELISHPQNFDVVSSQFLWFHLDLSHTHTKSCANKTTKARLCL